MSCSYQVVSEHSILSAQNDMQKKMEFGAEDPQHCVPEWKERFEEIQRHWRKRRKPEEMRCRTRRHHAPTRRSGRRDTILKKIEETLVNLRSSISDLRKELEGAKESGEIGRDTNAPEKNQKGGIKEMGSEAMPEQATMEGQKKRVSPEDTTPEALTENDAMTVKVLRTVFNGEVFPSPWKERRYGSDRERTPGDSPSEARPKDLSPEAPCLGGAATKAWSEWGGEELSFVVEACNVFGEENDDSVEWSSIQVDRVISVGQAQYLLLTPTQITKNEVSLLSTSRAKRTLMDLSFASMGQAQLQVSNSDHLYLKKVDLTSNPMGQTHHFIITPTIFTNSGGVLQVEKELDQKKLMGLDGAQNPYLSMNFKANASVFGIVGAPKIEMENMKILFPTNTTILKRCKVKEGDVNILIIMESPFVHEWDPGGLKVDGWDPSGFKRDDSIQESVNTSAMGEHENSTVSTQIWGQLFNISFVFLNTPGLSTFSTCIGISYYTLSIIYDIARWGVSHMDSLNTFSVGHGMSVAWKIAYWKFFVVQGIIIPLLEMLCGSRYQHLQFETLFESKACTEMWKVATSLTKKLAQTAHETFGDFEEEVEKDAARTVVLDGIAHHITHCVSNYVKFFYDHQLILKQLFQEFDPGDPKAQLAFVTTKIMQALQISLDGKSEQYKDSTLTKLFLMSNTHYIVRTEIRLEAKDMLRDDWVKMHGGSVEQHAQVFLNSQQVIGFKGYYVGASVSSKMLKSHVPIGIFYVSCIAQSFSSKIWDPGRSAKVLKFKGRPHLVLIVGIKGTFILCFVAKKGKGNERLNLGGCSILCIVWFSCLKPWDPGGNCYTSYITWSLCFQLWDPGRRPLSLLLTRCFHLEDKVNFERGSIDEILSLVTPRKPNRFGKAYSRRGKRVIEIDSKEKGRERYVTNWLMWQVRENRSDRNCSHIRVS